MWIVQQLRQAFPFESTPRFLFFDRDAKFGLEVPAAIRSMKIDPLQTSYQSPWQNGVAERWVGSRWRDLLDHVITLNEQHLKRLLAEFVRHYYEDRTHLGLAKQTWSHRICSCERGRVIAKPVLGGLHHRYDQAA
jgi:putative transposase